MKKLFKWFKNKNEFTFIIILIVFIWFLAPKLLRLIDPETGEFGAEVLYVPLIAGIYFFVGLILIWAYILLIWPDGYKILNDIFNVSKLTPWQKSQIILRLFISLIALYAISLLAVTGISAIMS